MKDWSITEKIYLYIYCDGETVSIANPESKKFWGPVQKKSNTLDPPRVVDNKGSDIKITDGRVYLKVDGKYLRLDNLFKENLVSQFSGATLTNGEASGVIFGFSWHDPDKVVLMFPGSSFYQEIEDKYIRDVSISLCKKTTKYVPGHRYDSESGSLWFIGKYYTHLTKADTWSVSGYKNPSSVEAYVFSNYLPPSKKVSDIFREADFIHAKDPLNFVSRLYPNSVIYTCSCKSMVDAGKELELDMKLEDSYCQRVDKYLETGRTLYSTQSDRVYYSGFSKLVSIFEISSESVIDQSKIDSIRGEIKEVLEKNLEYIKFKLYNTRFLTGTTVEGLINSFMYFFSARFLEKKFSNSFIDNQNHLKGLLHNVFGFDLELMVKSTLNGTFVAPSLVTFRDYLNNISFLEYREEDSYLKVIDFTLQKTSKRKLSLFLPNCPYRNMIYDILKEALRTNGSNLGTVSINKIGPASNPILNYNLTITIEDLMRNCEVTDPNDLPEKIKSDLLNLHIYKLNVITNSDILFEDE